PVCGVGVDNACVNAEGNVYPCAGFQGITLGNVSQQSLADIWANSEALKALRAVTNASFPQCLNCAANDYCAMCLVRNFNESGGDIFAINEHYCKVAFLTRDLVTGTAGN
ncbi:MAG: SPASM domain-containing protein, partial [Calditrichaeota bacterium]|nr:SPASM domain-containing protein [Calditrichota bacterium]